MRSYVIHYSNSPESPTLAEPIGLQSCSLEEAIDMAERNFSAPSLSPTEDEICGYSISDAEGKTVVPWRKGRG